MFNLRKQIAALKKENAGQERTIDLLREERDRITADNVELQEKVDRQEINMEYLRSQVAEQKATIAKQNQTIRKQSEADLLLNALQAVGIVPKPEPEIDNFARAVILQEQMAKANHRQELYSPLVQAIGGAFGQARGF